MAIEKVELKLGDGIDVPHLRDEVEDLQKRLRDWGVFPTNADIDGKFGSITKVAVERFQSLRPADPARSQFVPEGLRVDGIVSQKTWAELLKVSPNEITIGSKAVPVNDVPADFPDIDSIVTTAKVPPSLHARARMNIPLILRECVANGVVDRGQIAYVLATAEHESLLGELMLELADGFDYEPVSELATELGNTERGDGPRYKGRGFVQITGRKNYTNWSDKLGIKLVEHPEKTMLPEVAVKILVLGMKEGSFTGFRLGQFIAGATKNFVGARQIVNGRNRDKHIAEIAEFYFQALT
jgi:hypothetical protein